MAEEASIVSGMAGRYAQALFELARDQGVTDSVGADLGRFAALINENADMARLVRSPVFSAEQQGNAIGAVLDAIGISGLASNFLKLVASKRRLFAVADMIRDYKALDDSAKGVRRATVTVAEPLSPRHLDVLKTAIAEISGGRSVEMDVKIDPAIIGGLIVKLGSRMVDGSLKTKLNTIRMRMKEVG